MSVLQTEKKKSERGVCASLQQDQINVGALVREKEKNAMSKIFGGSVICSYIWGMSVSYLKYMNFARANRV